MKKFLLEMTQGEADALVELAIRGLDTVKRSTPDEVKLVDKLTALGHKLEDAR